MDCKEGTKVLMLKIADLVCTLDNQTYSKSLAVFKGSSVGQHFRHILDFYQCFFKGVNTGEIDYAKRIRDTKIEVDTASAERTFRKIALGIEDLQLSQTVNVHGDFSNEHFNNRSLVKSSIGRELMFLHDHAVHHLALIRIGIQLAFPQLDIDENLGVAPSTIKYRAGGKAPDC